MAKQDRGSVEVAQDEPKATVKKQNQLPSWDKFLMDVQPVHGKEKTYKMTCIRIERQSVSDEETVNILNSHSHSTLRRFYPQGEKKVGDEEIVTVN
jgi:hypothetical protein